MVYVSNLLLREDVVARTVSSDAHGNYEIPSLKAGTCQVTTTMSRFKKSLRDDVRLRSNVVRLVETTLEDRDVATEVAVNALIQTPANAPVRE